ncbi:cathepsin O-like isoform X2 [Galleria mellonella]|uniref:Cathepsin O-like isoform X2 n=1 Tax=Galleria mellonella TaxID=7137 RepID=A0ABM3ME48_GALME|nr:cathepsin O-like isoform X2 [Galleria mellonella]XP_052749689.1 cathepsin O-like isoform X2 [Galleria mellonella]
MQNSTLEIIRLNKLENSLNVESAVYGHSKYSDWSEEEFAKVMLTKMMSSCKKSSRRSFSSYEELNIPKMMDWRQKGVVGPILDQKMCSGCWAISIVGVMETMLAIGLQKNGTMRPLTKLSIQELIDCSKRNDGCRGGKPSTALEYLKKSRLPIVTEEQYPLLLVDQTCKIRGRPNGVLVTDYTDLCNAQEEEMLRLLAKHGTLIAVVNAKLWQHYVGGVIHKGCLGAERYLNHVIQIVGYDLTASTPYYIVKNSWGEDFGDEGYVKIAIGHNVCGIADEISYLNV